MKLVFDTDVVLDLLLNREPHATPAARLFSFADKKEIAGFLCATTVTTIYYLCRKAAGKAAANRQLDKLLTIFQIAPVDHKVLRAALNAGFADFEDAVVHESAVNVRARGIVTRNVQNFKKSRLTVFSPRELLLLIASR